MSLSTGIIIGSIIGIFFSGLKRNIDLVLIYGAILITFASIKIFYFVFMKNYKVTMELLTGLFLSIFVPIFLYKLEN